MIKLFKTNNIPSTKFKKHNNNKEELLKHWTTDKYDNKFLVKTMQAKRQWNSYKVLKEKQLFFLPLIFY
jgi:hypothetical protein